jgi:hypothetical protein
MYTFDEKNRPVKSRATVPLKNIFAVVLSARFKDNKNSDFQVRKINPESLILVTSASNQC